MKNPHGASGSCRNIKTRHCYSRCCLLPCSTRHFSLNISLFKTSLQYLVNRNWHIYIITGDFHVSLHKQSRDTENTLWLWSFVKLKLFSKHFYSLFMMKSSGHYLKAHFKGLLAPWRQGLSCMSMILWSLAAPSRAANYVSWILGEIHVLLD